MGGQLGFITEKHHEGVKATNQHLRVSVQALEERIAAQADLISQLSEERLTREAEFAIELERATTKAIQETEKRTHK